jgi:hypothetical protein
VGAALIHADRRPANSLIPLQSKRALLWRFNVACSNRTYIDRHVKWPIFLPNFNKFWILSTDFYDFPISRKSVHWVTHWHMRTDGRTDMTKAIRAFCKLKLICHSRCSSCNRSSVRDRHSSQVTDNTGVCYDASIFQRYMTIMREIILNLQKT